MDLSIVTTLYQSAPHIKEFYGRMTSEAGKITQRYEILFVNDGSTDNSLEIAVSLYEKDLHVKVVDLSRNFGHHKAIMTGLSYAHGALIFLIDSDLEEDPELLGTFYSALKDSPADVVYGVQEARTGSLLQKLSGTWFYRLFNLLSDDKIPRNLLTVRLMSRRYVANLIAHKEREPVMSLLWELTGFQQIPIKVRKKTRSGPTYTLEKRAAMMVRTITASSSTPLIFIACLGAVIVLLTGPYLLYLIAVRLFFGRPPEGYTSVVISIWFLGGLIILNLGIIALYLATIFIETKQRPYTIVREIYDNAPAKASQTDAGSRTLLQR